MRLSCPGDSAGSLEPLSLPFPLCCPCDKHFTATVTVCMPWAVCHPLLNLPQGVLYIKELFVDSTMRALRWTVSRDCLLTR